MSEVNIQPEQLNNIKKSQRPKASQKRTRLAKEKRLAASKNNEKKKITHSQIKGINKIINPERRKQEEYTRWIAVLTGPHYEGSKFVQGIVCGRKKISLIAKLLEYGYGSNPSEIVMRALEDAFNDQKRLFDDGYAEVSVI